MELSLPLSCAVLFLNDIFLAINFLTVENITGQWLWNGTKVAAIVLKDIFKLPESMSGEEFCRPGQP